MTDATPNTTQHRSSHNYPVQALKRLILTPPSYGANISATEYSLEGEYRFIRTTDIVQPDLLKEQGAVYVDFESVSDATLNDGDILFSRSGTLGRCFLYNPSVHGLCAHAGYLVRFSIDPFKLSSRFLAYYSQGKPFQDHVNAGAIKTTIANFNAEKYANIRIPVPPLETQRRIAAFLDRKTAAIDDLIAKKQRLIELLEEKRAALINRVVTKGLNPDAPMKDSGVPWIGDIPAHWEMTRVKRISDVITSGSRGWGHYYSDTGPVFLRITNIQRNSTTLDLSEAAVQRVQLPATETEGSRTLTKHNDVLVSITADIGSVGLVPKELGEAYVSQHVALVRPTEPHRATHLAWVLKSVWGSSHFTNAMRGGTKQGLGLNDVGSAPYPRISVLETRALADLISKKTKAIAHTISETVQSSLLLSEYRQALITAAVTGQIDVDDDQTSDDPEEMVQQQASLF